MASGNDMKAANNTYGSFTTFIKWGSLVALVAAAVVVLLIAS